MKKEDQERKHIKLNTFRLCAKICVWKLHVLISRNKIHRFYAKEGFAFPSLGAYISFTANAEWKPTAFLKLQTWQLPQNTKTMH